MQMIYNIEQSIYTDYVGNFVVHFYKFQNLFFVICGLCFPVVNKK